MEYQHLFKLTIYSHFFKVVNPTPRALTVILRFCSKYVSNNIVTTRNQGPINNFKVFAGKTVDNSEFRFHIGQLPDFFKALEYNFITSDLYKVEVEPMYKPDDIKVLMKPSWVLKDYQESAKSFILDESDGDNRSRLVSIQTGRGKTVTALSAIPELKSRTAIVILPQYIEKWCGDITNILEIKPKEIMPIQGSAQLKGVIDAAINKQLEAKFIVISISTYRNFIKSYDLGKSFFETEGYGCAPEDFCKTLGIGSIIIDETHQHLHAVFKFLMHTHVPKVIALSATLISDDPFIQKIQHLMFPKEIRFDKVEYNKYIRVFSIAYDITREHMSKIRTTEFGSKNYSHNAFEKSILKHKQLLSGYEALLKRIIEVGYLSEHKPKDKLLIFAASIKMCTHLTKYLKHIYPNKDVRRYVEDDPYENIMEAEIAVSTIQSAGTALDIADLRVVIMTTSISSSTSNLQALGRLRELKDRDVKFYYTWSPAIKKQREYHEKKHDIFSGKVLSHKDFESGMFI